jgi:C-terminal processing protease CtpA/Prc
MKTSTTTFLLLTAIAQTVQAFAPATVSVNAPAAISAVSPSALSMAKNDEELMRFSRAQRSAGADDRVLELKRPLGLVLNEDDNGNVFVETVAPRGNAARTGLVQQGDIVTMCSATFGDQMWSTRGVGLTRVLAAIRVRAGPTVKLVVESSNEKGKKTTRVNKAVAAAEEARLRAQDKKDSLLKELKADEKRIKKGKFLGLF